MANTQFMLENRFDAIASDQGANFVAAVRLLIEEGVGEEQVRCSCHKLQLSIKNALEEKNCPAASLIDLFRTISCNINNSPMLLDALRKRQHGNDLPCLLDQQDEDESHNDDDEDDIDTIHVAEAPLSSHGRSLKLIKDIRTRWNSTLFMLQRCILLKDAINHVLAESKYANLVPSAEQWLAAEKLSALLKPFQIATDFLQGEKYPTLGRVSLALDLKVQCHLYTGSYTLDGVISLPLLAHWDLSDLLLCIGGGGTNASRT